MWTVPFAVNKQYDFNGCTSIGDERMAIDLFEVSLQCCQREEPIQGHPIGSLNVQQLEGNIWATMVIVTNDLIAVFEAEDLWSYLVSFGM